MIRAAIGGQGLALVPKSLILNELATRELVNPARLSFPNPNCYWLTTPSERERSSELGLFCDWALGEAERTETGSRYVFPE